MLDPNKFFKKSKIENRYRILNYLDEFNKLYKNRPIKSNKGGMMFPQMFGLFYILKILKPKFVVESGIWKGQSTWLIEKVLHNAKVISIDVKLDKREYISKSKNVTYTNKDFKSLNFKNFSKKNSLVFLTTTKTILIELFSVISLDLKIFCLTIIIHQMKVIVIH